MTNRERESPVSEFDVLVATAIWLLDQRCSEITVSIAHGQGRPLQQQKKELEEILAEKGVAKISFVSHGPDLEAHDNARIWRVECKGLSQGAPSTVENNFERALASVVSYYDEPDSEVDSDLKSIIKSLHKPDRPIRLALALPHSDRYINLLRKRVKSALRRKLDLWVLMIDPEKKSVDCYDPEREI